MKAIVSSTVLYGKESWTMASVMEKKIAAFERKIFRRLLEIPYTAHVTNTEVKARIRNRVGRTEELLTTVQKKSYNSSGMSVGAVVLSHTVLEKYVEGKRKKAGQDRKGSAMLSKRQAQIRWKQIRRQKTERHRESLSIRYQGCFHDLIQVEELKKRKKRSFLSTFPPLVRQTCAI